MADKKDFEHKFDQRIHRNSFVLFVGPSGTGKTTAVCNILADSKHHMTEPVDHIVLITKHPGQQCYFDLAKAVKKLTFIQPENDIKEEDFIKSLNLQASKHMALFFDDVR